MRVAVLSSDAVLARMLQLESKRCGFSVVSPDAARILLLDLDHPVTMRTHAGATTRIGFSARPELVSKSVRDGLAALLPLPFSASELALFLKKHVDAPQHVLLRDGEELWLMGEHLHFSKTEQVVLSLLYENRHRVVTNDEISAIIGENAAHSNAVAVYLYRLRRKLEADGRVRITTVRGVGYRWMGEA